MGKHNPGMVVVLTARDRTGARVRLTQATTEEKYRRLARLCRFRLAKQPALYHDFRREPLTIHEAALYEWGAWKGDSSSPLHRSKAEAETIRPSGMAARVMGGIRWAWRAIWTPANRQRRRTTPDITRELAELVALLDEESPDGYSLDSDGQIELQFAGAILTIRRDGSWELTKF